MPPSKKRRNTYHANEDSRGIGAARAQGQAACAWARRGQECGASGVENAGSGVRAQQGEETATAQVQGGVEDAGMGMASRKKKPGLVMKEKGKKGNLPRRQG